MRRVAVEDIQEDMVLAKEVRGRSGNVLLNKGVKLNPFMGRRLKNWDISFVHIEGEDDSPKTESAVTVSPQEVKSLLEKMFNDVINNPIMKQIFAAVYQHKIQKANG